MVVIVFLFFFALDGNETDEDIEDIDPEDPEVNEETDLLLKFSRLKLKVDSLLGVILKLR